jgi:hypothetical protein
VVWFENGADSAADEMIFRVDLRRKRPERLPPPEDAGDGYTYLIESDGTVAAMTLDQEIEIDTSGPTPRLVQDRASYAPHPFPDGTDVLAHTLELREDGWHVLETKASRCCVPGAPGVSVLSLYARLLAGPDAHRLSQTLLTPRTDYPPLGDETLIKKLNSRLPPGTAKANTHWFAVTDPHWTYQFAFLGGGEGQHTPTGAAFLLKGKDLGPPLELPYAAKDPIRLEIRGVFLLLTDAHTGMHPYVYDMRTGRLVFASKLAHGAAFWPALTPP